MTQETENLVLEILRKMRADDATFRQEVNDAFNRVELRLSVLEENVANMLALSASDRSEMAAMKRRIERIERRLELVD
jgi:hypothetical protein